MAYELPPLPYAYNALEPYIDEQTMQLHHDKHHQAYVTNLNNALQGHTQFDSLSIEDLMKRLNEVPENIRAAVRNNGGGHVNHSMFWQIMKPNGGGEPTGDLGNAITQAFGSFDNFKAQFNDAGVKRFGSGWTWLVYQNGNWRSPRQPTRTARSRMAPIRSWAIDVWEHAYYLKYQNRRPDYLAAWWNVVNWDEINKRFQQARNG